MSRLWRRAWFGERLRYIAPALGPRSVRRLGSLALALVALVACSRAEPPGGGAGDDVAPPASVSWSASRGSSSPSSAPPPASAPAASSAPRVSSAPAEPLPRDDGRPQHVESVDELLKLFTVRSFTEKEIKMRGDPKMFLDKNFGVGTPSRINQGNKELAHHDKSRAECLAGLEGITIQTEEQRAICGAPNMVPIKRGKGRPKTCIDVFEFPNQPCEIPFVWIAPTQASALCELVGKRLCNQEEWINACRGDPEGGKDSMYAYGEELDLTACNTNKPARSYGGTVCDPDSARSAWNTCGTNTEPSGSFPRCRSRMGVFDLHGNVAEIMTRYDPDGHTYSQLKGSAFFYVDVARKHDERAKEGRETYPDHCGHDPRWHVERMDAAWHVNYHLGFRCCKTVR